jgi:monoamine oxidase
VGVFERTHHIGGRARSVSVRGAAIPLDVGAMRIPSHHRRVNALVDRFGLETRDFVVSGDANLQYFRGRRLTGREVARDPSQLPYDVRPGERGRSTDDLIASAIEAVIPDFRSLGEAEWEAAKRSTTVDVTDPASGQSKKVPLSELGLRDVLARTLSTEALAMVEDSVGYHSFLQNWDAGQALEGLAADFRPGERYRTPVEGMEALPRALARDLKHDGVKVRREHGLRRVDFDAASREFHLTFEDEDGRAVPVVARQLVLAMPKGPIARVVEDSPFLERSDLSARLGQVTQNPMTRIFATYDRPWWNESGIEAGRSVTDLPLDQVYYYGAPGDRHPYVEVYADGERSAFWEQLQDPSKPGVTTRLCAEPALQAELQKELEEMHGRPLPPAAGFLYKRWADPYLGAAYHTWNPGTRPFEAADAMIEPLPGVPLYVCGEAFSLTQGWIEGALQTADKVVEKLKGSTPAV